jgi:predicted CopG family antitoxin
MGTKTIGLKDDAYERLKARKREDESFTDLVNRLLDEATADWREGFGTLSDGDADELEHLAERAREQASQGLSTRQQEAVQELTKTESNDETA